MRTWTDTHEPVRADEIRSGDLLFWEAVEGHKMHKGERVCCLRVLRVEPIPRLPEFARVKDWRDVIVITVRYGDEDRRLICRKHERLLRRK